MTLGSPRQPQAHPPIEDPKRHHLAKSLSPGGEASAGFQDSDRQGPGGHASVDPPEARRLLSPTGLRLLLFCFLPSSPTLVSAHLDARVQLSF